jgi:hypothetical protein
MKLKEIIENSAIPTYGTTQPTAPQATPLAQQKMTPEQKKELLEMIGKFNECGKSLYSYGDVRKIAEDLLKSSELAERYALEESGEDWLSVGHIQSDYKTIRKEAAEFAKVAKEAWAKNEKMKSAYENMGRLLEKYYELN